LEQRLGTKLRRRTARPRRRRGPLQALRSVT
jgi:hypothetical protein